MLSKDMLRLISMSEVNIALIERFIKMYRKVEDAYVVDLLIKEMSERGCFYFPSDEYVIKVFGERIREQLSEYYIDGHCVLVGGMSIPMTTLNDTVVGVILNKPLLPVKYRYPEKFMMNKGKTLLVTKASFIKALDEQCIFLVEGVFDEIFLTACGFPACCINGASLNANLGKILNLIETKIIISDNDRAGARMFDGVSKVIKGNIVSVKIPTKDIADYLKTEENVRHFSEVMSEQKGASFPLRLVSV